MKPKSQNYLMKVRIIAKVLCGNGVRSDVDGLQWGQEIALKQASQLILMQVICWSKFEKHCSVVSYTDWKKAKTNG